MKLVLEIKHEKDLKLLLPLFERLKIQVAELPTFFSPNKNKGEKGTPKSPSPSKNYNALELAALFDQLKDMNAFSEITDPVAWQKQLRDEWN